MTKTCILLILCFGSYLAAIAQMQLKLSYGDSGVVKLAQDDFNEPVALLRQTDDTILLLANLTHNDTIATTDFALIRRLPDGSADLNFGNSGVARYDFNLCVLSAASAFVEDSSREIYVLGTGKEDASANYAPVSLMKVHANGQVNSGFGDNGTLKLQFNAVEEFPKILKLDHSSRLIVGGFSTDTAHTHGEVPSIARITTSGELDSSFGEAGKAYLRFPNSMIEATRHLTGGVLYDILELSDGSLLLGGGYSNGLNLIAYIAKLNSSGALDTAFFDHGYTAVDLTPLANSQIVKLKQANDGKIWFAATSTALSSRDHYIGNLDLGSEDFNVSAIDFNGNEDVVADLQITDDGKLFAIGKSILPQHNFSWYQSDYFAVSFIPTATFPFNHQWFTFSDDTSLRCGAVSSVMLSDNSLLCYGFKNSASETSELMLINIDLASVSGVADLPSDQSTQIYPNPAAAFAPIHFESSEKSTVVISDINGRTINANAHQAATMLPTGFYLVTFVNGARAETHKLVVH